jgi:DNA-binding NarL/FixJ family response regulator
MTQIGVGKPVTNDPDHPLVPIPQMPPRRAASFRRDRRQNGSLALIDSCPLRRACTIHLLRAHRFKMAQAFADAGALLAHGSTRPYRFAGVIICTGMHSVTEAAVRDQLKLVVNRLGPVPLIVMSDLDSSDEMVTAFREGARGYIPTSLEPHLVVEAIRMVLADVPFVPVEALLRLRRQPRHETEVACINASEASIERTGLPQSRRSSPFLVQGGPTRR